MGNEILLIDDDEELCDLLRDLLRREGFTLDAVHEGPRGLERAIGKEYAMVLLDVMLPGMSGFDVLRRIREQSTVPILMLTARGDDVDRIVGLEMGADDYLPKPFNPRELVARVRAIQRRSEQAVLNSGSGAGRPPVTVGDVELDPRSRVVTATGKALTVTALEFNLLEVLMRAAGQVVSREDLSEKVLGRRFSPFDRSIDVHVSNLRRKLGQGTDTMDRIKTIRGVGYQFVSV